jgi:hypothetical protein
MIYCGMMADESLFLEKLLIAGGFGSINIRKV